MSWERSPICVTVPSEGAICKTGSGLVSACGLSLGFTEVACESYPAWACSPGERARSGPGPGERHMGEAHTACPWAKADLPLSHTVTYTPASPLQCQL